MISLKLYIQLLGLALMLFFKLAAAQPDIVLQDDTGATVRLSAPARRIVSLAPHATENLYAAGAGDRLVGVVEYSDFPEAAKRVRQVGDFARPDLESIAALKPDLVVIWQSGNISGVLQRLAGLGLTVYQTQPDRLDDIPSNIEKLGRLTGSEGVSKRAATEFRQRLTRLRVRYSQQPPVKVFYQTWHKPLMSVGGNQVISEVIRLCGGDNIFAGLNSKAPNVSLEAVLAANPEAIIASGMGYETPIGLNEWRKWKQLKAVARGNLFHVPADLMQRPTPRLLDGAELLCRDLESVRIRRMS
jgi:iron complex transport system substrate-binding protein